MERKILSLEEHQSILYEILYTFDDFCKENNIRYFLAHGTLLGAIRHQGIIPWDDDVDVMMERNEYERFQKLIISNPPKGYRAYSIENTKHYYYPFIKFGKLGTRLIESDWKCVPKEGIGINMDVFPIDGCPQDRNDAEQFIVPLMNSILYNIRFWPAVEWRKSKRITYKLYYYIRTRPVFLKCFFKKLYRKTTRYELETSNFFFPFWSFNGTLFLHPKETIKDIIFVPFGTRTLPAPQGYDEILKRQYGDYMTPPTEKEKKSTHEHEIYIEESIL